MSKQIAVRLPEELVEFLDRRVSEGVGKSRAEVVAQALERDRRRQMAARDAEILAHAVPDADMDSLAEHVAHLPIDVE